MINRYSFQHFPKAAPQPGSSENAKFGVGGFNDTQIDDLTVYHDGLIVSARATSDVLDAFLDDLYAFVAADFGIEKGTPETRNYETSVIVTMDERVARKFDFLEGLRNDLAGFRNDGEYHFSGLRLEPDMGNTTTVPRFVFERRIRVPFSENQWFSAAPLKTADLLATLDNLEAQLLR